MHFKRIIAFQRPREENLVCVTFQVAFVCKSIRFYISVQFVIFQNFIKLFFCSSIDTKPSRTEELQGPNDVVITEAHKELDQVSLWDYLNSRSYSYDC